MTSGESSTGDRLWLCDRLLRCCTAVCDLVARGPWWQIISVHQLGCCTVMLCSCLCRGDVTFLTAAAHLAKHSAMPIADGGGTFAEHERTQAGRDEWEAGTAAMDAAEERLAPRKACAFLYTVPLSAFAREICLAFVLCSMPRQYAMCSMPNYPDTRCLLSDLARFTVMSIQGSCRQARRQDGNT